MSSPGATCNDAAKPPLTDYDVFINTSVSMTTSSLNDTGQGEVDQTYFAAGKDYIGIGATGATACEPDGALPLHRQELFGRRRLCHPG